MTISFREKEIQLTETRSTALEIQHHMTTDYSAVTHSELDELLMIYFKLQNMQMTRGIEVLLERSHDERSLFQQARDLEMKSQWDIATERYRELVLSSKEDSLDVTEEAASAYYRCLQAGGLWADILHTHSCSNATLSQSSQLLYWKMEASWRACDWDSLRRFVSELEWIMVNHQEQWNLHLKRGFNDQNRFEFGYYLSNIFLSIEEGKQNQIQVII